MRIIINILFLASVLSAFQEIEISQKQQSDLGIKVQKIIPAEAISYGPYNAMALLDNKDIHFVSTNMDAIVQDIYAIKFSPIKKGKKLLTLRSNALMQMQQEYIDARLDNENISQNYARDTKLESEGIIATKNLLASKQQKNSSDLKMKSLEAQLLTSGFTKAMLQKLLQTQIPIKELTLYSSVDGIIYDIEANLGENVAKEKILMRIYADGPRYLELDVPADIAQQIIVGENIAFASHKAKITAISPLVNPQNQSVKVRARIEDANGIFINKIYQANIMKELAVAFKVQKSSLVFSQNKPYIFKKTPKGFEVLDVTIINERTQCYIINAKLELGDSVAATSTAALLSAMEEHDE